MYRKFDTTMAIIKRWKTKAKLSVPSPLEHLPFIDRKNYYNHTPPEKSVNLSENIIGTTQMYICQFRNIVDSWNTAF